MGGDQLRLISTFPRVVSSRETTISHQQASAHPAFKYALPGRASLAEEAFPINSMCSTFPARKSWTQVFHFPLPQHSGWNARRPLNAVSQQRAAPKSCAIILFRATTYIHYVCIIQIDQIRGKNATKSAQNSSDSLLNLNSL